MKKSVPVSTTWEASCFQYHWCLICGAVHTQLSVYQLLQLIYYTLQNDQNYLKECQKVEIHRAEHHVRNDKKHLDDNFTYANKLPQDMASKNVSFNRHLLTGNCVFVDILCRESGFHRHVCWFDRLLAVFFQNFVVHGWLLKNIWSIIKIYVTIMSNFRQKTKKTRKGRYTGICKSRVRFDRVTIRDIFRQGLGIFVCSTLRCIPYFSKFSRTTN